MQPIWKDGLEAGTLNWQPRKTGFRFPALPYIHCMTLGESLTLSIPLNQAQPYIQLQQQLFCPQQHSVSGHVAQYFSRINLQDGHILHPTAKCQEAFMSYQFSLMHFPSGASGPATILQNCCSAKTKFTPCEVDEQCLSLRPHQCFWYPLFEQLFHIPCSWAKAKNICGHSETRVSKPTKEQTACEFTWYMFAYGTNHAIRNYRPLVAAPSQKVQSQLLLSERKMFVGERNP